MFTWYWIENSISQECNGIRSIALFASAIVLYVLFHYTLCVFDKSHPSKCFSYESISLFWYYIKQIMNVYSCNGKNIFTWWKMECSIQLGCRLVEWNIPSSPHENILTIALINIHYLYTDTCLTYGHPSNQDTLGYWYLPETGTDTSLIQKPSNTDSVLMQEIYLCMQITL
jgi:hypothetical protein